MQKSFERKLLYCTSLSLSFQLTHVIKKQEGNIKHSPSEPNVMHWHTVKSVERQHKLKYISVLHSIDSHDATL